MVEIRSLVEGITPFDGLEDEHRSLVLRWLGRTDDVFRRVRPRTPVRHLVSYFLPVDPEGPHVLLVDHVKAGKWLPAGGHVEPGESPVETVRREAAEELGVQAEFPPWAGEKPLLVTVTETVGPVSERHTDVSLWFVLSGRRHQVLRPDGGEFNQVRWWTPSEVSAGDPSRFDPHLGRMLDKVALAIR